MNFERIKQIASLNGLKIWNVKPGQEVEVHERIKDGKNERIWKFKGLVIKVNKKNSHDGTFVVRGKVLGITVEKIYPLSTNIIDKIMLLDKKKIRRSKLYFIREKIGKDARLKSILTTDKRGTEIEKVSIKANLTKEEKSEKKEKIEEEKKEEVQEEKEE